MSLNIVDLHELLQSFLGMLGIAQVHPGQTQADVKADMNHLGLSYLQFSMHQYIPGHTQTMISLNGFAQGGEKIRKVLPTFLQKYAT